MKLVSSRETRERPERERPERDQKERDQRETRERPEKERPEKETREGLCVLTLCYILKYNKIGLYFILPFIFSAVYNNYKNMLSYKEKQYIKRRDTGLALAFTMLDRKNRGTVDADLCRNILKTLAKDCASAPLVVDEIIDSVC